MKLNLKISELNHEDLVCLLSDAFYGNSYMIMRVPTAEYKKVPENKREGDCIEDKAADILLNGGFIYAEDLEADGEVYGTLDNEDDDDGIVRYKVRLQDILDGLSREDASDYVTAYKNETNDADTGYNAMQLIVFGDLIYG